MGSKAGIVLTGGGARASYQVGVLRAIYEITGKKEHLFDVITGNSAGAINSTFLAQQADNWDVGTNRLIELWKGLKPDHIFDLRKRAIGELGLRWVGGTLLGGLTKRGSQINHLLETGPLAKLLEEQINFDLLNDRVKDGHVSGMALAATNYGSGTSVIFYNSCDEIKPWTRSDRFGFKTAIQHEHVMASSAIPIFFPPIKIQDSYFGDGCIRQHTPLSPAIHLGADRILAIGVRHPVPQDRVRDISFSPISEPGIGQIAGTLLNAIFLDSIGGDVERLEKINQLIKTGISGTKDLKVVPTFLIQPSRDLGKMTAKLNQNLPTALRYLLKGIGVSSHAGLDLLSYLAFDESYTASLMELGYEDAFRRKEEILTFLLADV